MGILDDLGETLSDSTLSTRGKAWETNRRSSTERVKYEPQTLRGAEQRLRLPQGLDRAAESKEWTVVDRAMRHKRQVGPVLIVKRGVLTHSLSADEADQQKVILWASTDRPVATLARIWLQKEGFTERVLKIREHGLVGSRRLEVILESSETRDEVFQKLKKDSRWLGSHASRVVKGRTYLQRSEDRTNRRLTHPQTPRRLPKIKNQNLFWPLLEEAVEGGPWKLGEQSRTGFPIRVATFNANGLRLEEAMQLGQLTKRGLDLIGVAETYLSHDHKGYWAPGCRWFGRNLIPGTKRSAHIELNSHGVGFFVSNRIARLVEVVTPLPKFRDSMWIRIRGCVERRTRTGSVSAPKDMWVGLYYLSPNLATGGLGDAISEMGDLIRKAKSAGGEVVVMGDLNCNLHDGKANPRGRLIRRMCQATGLTPLRAKGHPATRHLRGAPVSTLDYILAEEQVATKWDDIKVWRETPLDSDHWLISSQRKSWFLPCCPREDPLPIGGDKGAGWKPRPSWNLSKLRERPAESPEHDVEQLLACNLACTAEKEGRAAGSTSMEHTEPDTGSPVRQSAAQSLAEKSQRALEEWRVESHRSVTEAYQDWSVRVTSVVDEVLGPARAPRRRRGVKPGFVDEELWSDIAARRKWWAKLRAAVNRSDTEEIRQKLWKAYRQAVEACRVKAQSKRAESWEKWIQRLGVMWKDDPKRFWKSVNRLRGKGGGGFGAMEVAGKGLVYPGQPEYIKEWKEYCEKLGNEESQRAVTDEIQEFHRKVRDEAADAALMCDPSPSPEYDRLNGPITQEEVTAIIKSLPSGKASGPDGIPNEIIKAMGESACTTLTQLFNRAFQEACTASHFQQAICCPLPKVEGTRKMSESRGISLLSCVGKLYTKVLNARIARFLETRRILIPEQGGFRKLWPPAKGRSTEEQTLTLVETLQRRKTQGMETYLAFIDLRKAYDRVWRDALWVKLAKAGIKGRMLRTLRQLYSTVEVAVRCNGQVSELFNVAIGLKQGCVLSPVLFLVFINDILEECKSMGLGVKVMGSTSRSSPWDRGFMTGLLWADDLVLVADTAADLRKMLNCMTTWLDKWKMEANAGKCAVMVCGKDGEESQAVENLEGMVKQPGQNFQIQGEEVPITTGYKYLGTIVSSDLGWDAERAARLKATNAVVQSLRGLLTQSSLRTSIRCHLLRATVYPVALYGAGLWYENQNSIRKLQSVVGIGQRMIVGAGCRTARTAIEWELGLIPLRIQAQASRARLLIRVIARRAEPGKPTSTYWLRALTEGKPPPSPKWGWFRHASKMAKKLLPKEYSKILAWKTMFGKTPDLDTLRRAEASIPSEMVNLASAEREKFASSHRGLRILRDLKGNCIGNSMERYLDIGCSVGIRILFRMRTNTLTLNSVASKWTSVPSSCLACGDRTAAETLQHFLLECPAVSEPRKSWFETWQINFGSKSNPNTSGALLGVDPQLYPELTTDQLVSILIGGKAPGGPKVCDAEVARPLLKGQQAIQARTQETRLLRARATGLSEMWNLRCRLQAASMKKRHSIAQLLPPLEPKSLGHGKTNLGG